MSKLIKYQPGKFFMSRFWYAPNCTCSLVATEFGSQRLLYSIKIFSRVNNELRSFTFMSPQYSERTFKITISTEETPVRVLLSSVLNEARHRNVFNPDALVFLEPYFEWTMVADEDFLIHAYATNIYKNGGEKRVTYNQIDEMMFYQVVPHHTYINNPSAVRGIRSTLHLTTDLEPSQWEIERVFGNFEVVFYRSNMTFRINEWRPFQGKDCIKFSFWKRYREDRYDDDLKMIFPASPDIEITFEKNWAIQKIIIDDDKFFAVLMLLCYMEFVHNCGLPQIVLDLIDEKFME